MYQKYEVTVKHVVKTKAFPCASGQNSLSAEKKSLSCNLYRKHVARLNTGCATYSKGDISSTHLHL